MEHDPERVRDRIREHEGVDERSELSDEVERKLLTSLIGYDPRARLLTVFIQQEEPMHQEELRARAGIGLDEYEDAMEDLLRLGAVEVARAEDGIPFYQMSPESGAGAAIEGAERALTAEQARRESSDSGA